MRAGLFNITDMSTLRWTIAVCAAGLLVLLGGSYLGRFHPLGDSLAVIRPWLAIGLALFGLALWHRLATPVAVLVAGLALGPILWARYAPVPPVAKPTLTLYQKNMRFDSGGPQAMRDDIRASGADIVTLQEVTIANRALMDDLRDIYPTQNICPFYGSSVGGVAIMSRLPLADAAAQCGAGNGIASLRLRLPDGRAIEAASIHLHWPWPSDQATQAGWIANRFRGGALPLIVGGDFNMVPESHVMRHLAWAAHGHMLGPRLSSFPRFAPLLPLAIDHVIVPEGATGRISLRPLVGSDHHGLLAQIAF